MLHLEIAKYRLGNKVYKTSQSIMEELQANGFNVTKQHIVTIDKSLKIATTPKVKLKFEDIFNQYCFHMNNAQVFDMSKMLADNIAVSHPLVKQAYDLLGEPTVKALNYNISKVQRKLDAMKQTSLIDRIITMSHRTFAIGKPIPLSVIKTKLQEIYNELGIQTTAKATDIADWCEVIDSSIYSNGKKIKCKTIVRYKILRVKS